MTEMKKYRFVLSIGMARGKKTDTVELPADYTESEIENEFIRNGFGTS